MRSRGREIAHDAIHEGMTEYELVEAIDTAIKECVEAAKSADQPFGFAREVMQNLKDNPPPEDALYLTDQPGGIASFDDNALEAAHDVAARHGIKKFMAAKIVEAYIDNLPERESGTQPDGRAQLDATGIATNEEIKKTEFSLMARLLNDDCGNGAVILSRILNRLTKAESSTKRECSHRAIATVTESNAGPYLYVDGKQIFSWLGTTYNERANAIAEAINDAHNRNSIEGGE